MQNAVFYNDENNDAGGEYRGGISFLSSVQNSTEIKEMKEMWKGGIGSYQRLVVPFVLSHKHVMKKKWISGSDSDGDSDSEDEISVIDNATFDKLFYSCSYEVNNKGKRKTMKNQKDKN